MLEGRLAAALPESNVSACERGFCYSSSTVLTPFRRRLNHHSPAAPMTTSATRSSSGVVEPVPEVGTGTAVDPGEPGAADPPAPAVAATLGPAVGSAVASVSSV